MPVWMLDEMNSYNSLVTPDLWNRMKEMRRKGNLVRNELRSAGSRPIISC
jgi:hypothetical protein